MSIVEVRAGLGDRNRVSLRVREGASVRVCSTDSDGPNSRAVLLRSSVLITHVIEAQEGILLMPDEYSQPWMPLDHEIAFVVMDGWVRLLVHDEIVEKSKGELKAPGVRRSGEEVVLQVPRGTAVTVFSASSVVYAETV